MFGVQVTEDTELTCLGCNLTFLKEVLFFKHAGAVQSQASYAGAVQSQASTQCSGKPREDDIIADLVATPPRCLHCKESFLKVAELKKHLTKENCVGPIYIRKVVKPQSQPLQEIKALEPSDKQIAQAKWIRP